MKKIIKDYFSFNSRERLTIILLCCLMAFFWVLPDWYPQQKNVPNTSANKWVESSIGTTKLLETLQATKSTPLKPDLPLKLFVFDPNLLSEVGWKQLGLKDKTIRTIQHYLQKGGRFHKPEDLKKIWGILPEEADRLIPYIQIEEPKNKALVEPIVAKKAPITPVLINQATAAELEALPGMNKFLAARMIKFRDKIGGFQNLDQVRRTYGLTDSIFNLIAPLMILKE